MPGLPNDFRVEIIKGRPQTVPGIQFQTVGGLEVQFDLAPDTPGEVVDITGRVTRDGFGTINRAMERDLLSFKTGDLALTALNGDGFFDAMFAPVGFDATTIWSLRVYRRGAVQYWGVVIGLGSITFDRKAKTVAIATYGLTKLLDMTSAELVRRAFPDPITVTTATGGTASLTLNSTVGLLTGDTLHLTDHVNQEDVTVKQVTSATVVQLEAVLAHGYAAGLPVTVSTRFRRYEAISFLVTQLFKAAFVGMAETKLSNSQFSQAAPTPINLSGLVDITKSFRRGLTQKGGLRVQTIHGDQTYSQVNPDNDWVPDGGGANTHGWMDWTKYYAEGSAEPAVHLRDPSADGLETAAPDSSAPQSAAYDFYCWDAGNPTTRHCISINTNGGAAFLQTRGSTDGTTWSGASNLAAQPAGATPVDFYSAVCEIDPVRSIVVCSWMDSTKTNAYLYYYDLNAAAWTNMKPAGDAALTGYFGPTYCADLDVILCLKSTAGPEATSFTICAFRGAVKLWERPFPSNLVNHNASNNVRAFYPTRSIRSVGGVLYGVCVSDGAVQFVSSADQFQTYKMSKVYDAPALPHALAARINGTYCFAAYKGTNPRGHAVAAPLYAGVVDYADFTGLSAAEGLKKLAVLCNALFWVDDDCQGHFVARDLYDPGAVLDISDRLKERHVTAIWDQTAQYVKVSGNGFEATSGNNAFAADGIELESSFMPNAAFAQALADAYYAFYSAARQYDESTLRDPDGNVFRPLDRVTPDSLARFLVYESDHSLIDDEVQVRLLEDR